MPKDVTEDTVTKIIQNLENQIQLLEAKLSQIQADDIDGYLALLQEIEQKKRLLAQLRAKNEEIRQLKQTVKEGIEELKEKTMVASIGVTNGFKNWPVLEMQYKLLPSLWIGGGVVVKNIAAISSSQIYMLSTFVLDFYSANFQGGIAINYPGNYGQPVDFGLIVGVGGSRGVIAWQVRYNFGTKQAMALLGYQW